MARILAISHDAHLYGAQRSLLDVVTGLAAAGHAVEVCVPADGELVALLQAQGIPVHVSPFRRWVAGASEAGAVHRLRWIVGLPRAVWRAARLVRAGRYDVVYTNTVTVLDFALAARWRGVPHVWHLRESAASNPQLRSPLSNARIIALVRALSARVVYNSRYLLARYGGRPSARDVVVHNGLRPRPARQARASQASGDRLRVLTAGYMDHGKGVDVLLDAVALLPAPLRARMVLHVAGHIEPAFMARALAPRLERLGPTVELLGWVDPIDDLLASADLLVSSAREETFGRTLVEAMFAGVAVLATRSGGPEEIVVDGVTGLLVPADDPQALCDALARLLAEPALLAVCGKAGRERAQAQFSLVSCVRGVERCLLEAIADACTSSAIRP